MTEKEQVAMALAQQIVAGELPVDIDEWAAWAEVGDLLGLRFSDWERQDVMFLRKVRHGGGRLTTLENITRAAAPKVSSLIVLSERFRRTANLRFPYTRAGIALMARAGMLEREVRTWRLPCEHLP